MIEKMCDGCPVTGIDLSELRRFPLVAITKSCDQNRYDMFYCAFGKIPAKLMFQKTLANRFGIPYTVFHKTSLLSGYLLLRQQQYTPDLV